VRAWRVASTQARPQTHGDGSGRCHSSGSVETARRPVSRLRRSVSPCLGRVALFHLSDASSLFLAIHLPGWIGLHLLTVEKALSVFILSTVLALTFKASDSLWAPIVVHSANDFMSFLLFGV
jgi:hypothetical protein